MSLAPLLGARAGMIQARLQQEQIERDREERRMQMIGQSVQQAAQAIPQAISAGGGVYNQIQRQKMAQAKLEAEAGYRAQEAARKAAKDAEDARHKGRIAAIRAQEAARKAAKDAGDARYKGRIAAIRERGVAATEGRLGLETQANESRLEKAEREKLENQTHGAAARQRAFNATAADNATVEGPPAPTSPVFDVDSKYISDPELKAAVSKDAARERKEQADLNQQAVELDLKQAKAEAPQNLSLAISDKGAKLAYSFRKGRELGALVAKSDTAPEGSEDKIRWDMPAKLRAMNKAVGMPNGASLSIGSSVSGPFFTFGANASTGGLEQGREIQVALDRYVAENFTIAEKEYIRLALLSNRVTAKSIEGRLTDVDAQFYDGALISYFTDEAHFKTTYNDALKDSARSFSEFAHGQKGGAWHPNWKQDALEADMLVSGDKVDAEGPPVPGRARYFDTNVSGGANVKQMSPEKVLADVVSAQKKRRTNLIEPTMSMISATEKGVSRLGEDAVNKLKGVMPDLNFTLFPPGDGEGKAPGILESLLQPPSIPTGVPGGAAPVAPGIPPGVDPKVDKEREIAALDVKRKNTTGLEKQISEAQWARANKELMQMRAQPSWSPRAQKVMRRE